MPLSAAFKPDGTRHTLSSMRDALNTEREEANRLFILSAFAAYRPAESREYVERFALEGGAHLVMRDETMAWICTGDDPGDDFTRQFLARVHAYAIGENAR